MFDFEPERDWEDEPTLAEMQMVSRQVQLEIIQKYKLKTEPGSDTTLAKTKSLADCQTAIERGQHATYLSARKCLGVSVFTAKAIVPHRYFYLFDELLTTWMPEIG